MSKLVRARKRIGDRLLGQFALLRLAPPQVGAKLFGQALLASGWWSGFGHRKSCGAPAPALTTPGPPANSAPLPVPPTRSCSKALRHKRNGTLP